MALHVRDDMPDAEQEPRDAAEWIRSKIVGALGAAKLWPVRLACVRHQEELSVLVYTLRIHCRIVFYTCTGFRHATLYIV